MAKQKTVPMRKLKAMRALRGFTLCALAQKTGLNRDTIGDYEKGNHSPRFDNLKKIAAALECDLTDIY